VSFNSANLFCGVGGHFRSGIDILVYTVWAGAEGRATQRCDLSADSGPDHTVPGMSSRYPRFFKWTGRMALNPGSARAGPRTQKVFFLRKPVLSWYASYVDRT